jgi:hypothetical protein
MRHPTHVPQRPLRKAVGLLAGGAAAAALAAPPAAPAGGSPSAPTMGPPAAATTVTGRVVDGDVAVGGAIVVLRAWPSRATQAATPVGTRQSLFTVGIGRTAADGSYSLAGNLAGLPRAYRAADGTVDLMVMALHDGRLTETSLPAGAATRAAPLAPLDLAHGVESRAAVTAERVLSADLERRGGAAESAAGGGFGGVPDVCGGGSWSSPYGPFRVKVATAAAGTGLYAIVDYGVSEATTLGVAFEGGGGWQASGTSTVGTSSGFTTEPLVNKRVFAWWDYHDWISGCGGYRTAYPQQYVGHAPEVSIAHPHYRHCGSPYNAGATYVHGATTNETYSNGLTVHGITLSSHAGWDSHMTLRIHFDVRGIVCGNNASRESAPRVEAHRT